MNKMELYPWILHYDYDATIDAYKNIKEVHSTRCGCIHCKNFLAVRDDAYPDIIKDLFLKIGIDYTKEYDAAYTCRLKTGYHLYLGWFNFIGKLETFKKIDLDTSCNITKVTGSDSYTLRINDRFSFSMTDTSTTHYDDVFIGKPIVEIFFSTQVPWGINEKEPKR